MINVTKTYLPDIDKDKIINVFGVNISDWETSLDIYIMSND